MRSGSLITAEEPGSRETQTREWVGCRRTSARRASARRVLVPGVRRPGRGDASTPSGLTCHGHRSRPDDVRRRWAGSDPSPSRSLSWGDATRGRMWTARRSWRRFSRLVTDGDMSPFDHPLGDVRPWMAVDASATVSPWPAVPRSSRCAHPGSASCTGWAVRGARPPHLLPLWQAEGSRRCAARLLLRAGTGGGMEGMRAQRQVALRGLTALTHRRPRSSGRAE
jgi:hypothetical protein